MTRRLKRQREFELTLEVKDDNFIRPPKDAQRNWLLNKAMSEFSDDLQALHGLAARFVPGADRTIPADRTQSALSDSEIMEDWQIPLMRAMAEIATETHGHLLEVGFGRGISAEFVQQCGVRKHTIIECNDSVVERFQHWRAGYPEREINLIYSKWQDVTDQLEQYDSILFHTYPLDPDEYVETIVKSVTFAEHFFPTAAAHLKPGGIFTYFTGEMDSFSRAHQRLVLRYFREFTLRPVKDLPIPADVTDTWWLDSIMAIKAVK